MLNHGSQSVQSDNALTVDPDQSVVASHPGLSGYRPAYTLLS